ncbi:uncharacterized protein N7511_008992 [Penicillium nucicola]|uniref:uncharacterized protein n=1 Tax=Penicillium nucicola TaxID=1850975 RepID=UPI002545705A|nr:uncharacterized protein N7511_008992 [Penicillium nucicola]KAJ5747296.1 hypothetical protein N7511_008992 [Penicillium nucicola]
MLWIYLIAALIQLCWVTLGLSESTVTIPWVGDGPDYFQGYGAKVLGSHGDTTSYAINCLAAETTCQSFSPDLTVVAGPLTYEVIGSGAAFDIKSDCTFIGDPSPTLATCVQTISYHKTPVVTTSSITVTGTMNQMTGIYPAMLCMTETGDSTTTNQPAKTEVPVSTKPPVSTTTSSLATTSTVNGQSTVAETEAQISTATETQILRRPGNSTIYSNGTETVTVSVFVTERPAAVTCKCDCEYPQVNQTVISKVNPNGGNNITAKKIGLTLLGAILTIVAFCI